MAEDACWKCHSFRKPRYYLMVIGLLIVLFACTLSIIPPIRMGQQKSSLPVARETIKQNARNMTAETDSSRTGEPVIPAVFNQTVVGVNDASVAAVGAPPPAVNALAPRQQELWILSSQNAGRLGNQIWQFASTLGIYHQAKRTWTNSSNVHLCFSGRRWPFDTFDSAGDKQCPNLNGRTRTIFVSEKGYAKYQHFDLLETCRRRRRDKCIVQIGGYRQSHLYLRLAEPEIRQALVFHDSLLTLVNHTWHTIMDASNNNGTTSNNDTIVTVGIHVRRTDVAGAHAKGQAIQMRLAPNQYYVNAMEYFCSKYGPNVRFVVASDDKEWCQQQAVFSNATVLPLTLSVETDFALLCTKCQHMIMSVGTFGWWAGWLARGDVVYYDKGLNLEARVNKGNVNLTHYYPE